MAKCTMRVAVLLVSLGMLSPAFGFWFTTSRAKSQTPQWFGIRDYGGAAVQSAYSYDTSGGVTVAVPVAVPLSPQSVQMSPPYTGLGAVELVPCLCPIAKNPEAIKPLPVNAAPAPPVPVAMPPMQVMPMHTHQQQQQHQQHLQQQQQQHQQQQHPQQPQQHQHQPHQQQQQHQPQQHQ